MTLWKKTFCPLCYHNCGLEVQTEGHRILKVRSDKQHPRTKGYICRKGARVAHYQDHPGRLLHPLKRERGQFVRISWDQAIREIAARLREILGKQGPPSLAFMGGGGQGSHMETGFARTLLTSLGSQYHYSPLAQELTGLFWVNGRAFGRQHLHLGPDLDRARNFLVTGWNGAVSHAGVNRARSRLHEFAKDPDKRLIVVDPLRSETARMANLHVPIRMGTVSLFLKTLIALVLQQGWEATEYLEDYCQGFEEIRKRFQSFDATSALRVCGIKQEMALEVARTLAKEPTAIRSDLGLLMDRQSTMNSYLEMLLMAICGRIGTPGGNVFVGHVLPLGIHSDERRPETWRTKETGIPAIMGVFPPNVAPEEILSPREDRLRALIVSGSNPLRSYADTLAYERAFERLDLSVTIEVAMTETAEASQYILPARSAFEKWDATLFSLTFPEIHFQMRGPCCEAKGEPLEEGEIYLRLARELGLLPAIPSALSETAGDRKAYALALLTAMGQDPALRRMLPFVVAHTLGKALNSAHLSAIWGMMLQYPPHAVAPLTQAGYEVTPFLGDELFAALLEKPQGILMGVLDPENNLEMLRTPDKRIHLHIPELDPWLAEIEPEQEEAALHHPDYPLVLMAGRHFPYNANTIQRDPAWNEHQDVCTLLIHEQDARSLGVKDGGEVLVATEATQVSIRAEISDIPVPGAVVIPHGFGLRHAKGVYGVNVNQLTRSAHRDRIAGTPLHRYVPCRVTAV